MHRSTALAALLVLTSPLPALAQDLPTANEASEVEVLHILPLAVVDAMMMETPLQANKANMLVDHHICARRNDVSDSTLDVVGGQIGNRASNKVATTL